MLVRVEGIRCTFKAAGHADTLTKLGSGWTNWQQAKRNLAQAKKELDKARAEEEWLRDAVEKLERAGIESAASSAVEQIVCSNAAG